MTVTTRILAADDAGVRRAAEALVAGEPVVIPTETVYGLAADATNPDAVGAVFAAKARPADDPLIVHVAPGQLGADTVAGLAAAGIVAPLDGPRKATTEALVARFWPGPLTLVLPRGASIPPSVSSRLPTVAVRMPAHPVARAIIEASGRALVAPSANLFGRISPTTAEAAKAELDGRIRYVVDGGRCDVGVESTVLRVDEDGGIGLLRPGAITAADVVAATGHAPYPVKPAEGTAGSPGRMLRHYAPNTPLVVTEGAPSTWTSARWDDLDRRLRKGDRHLGFVAFHDAGAATELLRARLGATVHARVLAPAGTVEEAAHNLYATLRELDALGADLLVVERTPGSDGLAAAVADRLSRAAHGTEPLAR